MRNLVIATGCLASIVCLQAAPAFPLKISDWDFHGLQRTAARCELID